MTPVADEQILIVEDDDTIAQSLARALSSQGYVATTVGTGDSALHHLDVARVDLVLLDLGLPDMDGIDVCRAIRRRDTTIPIVLLTARQEEIDIVVGLDAGAVDYVTKPFRLAELFARLRVQLRRTETGTGAVGPQELHVGELRVDTSARRAWFGGVELDLRAKELDLLIRLAQDAGRVVTRETLMADVWDEHWFGSTKTLDVHIASLRRKLEHPDRRNDPITTLRGVGYRYERS